MGVWGMMCGIGGCSLGLRTARDSSDNIDWKKAKFYSYFSLVLPETFFSCPFTTEMTKSGPGLHVHFRGLLGL